jgi:hypothetical protein
MTVESLTERWRRHLFHHLERPHVGKPLQAAALSGKLAAWTTELTGAVVEICAAMGWRAAAKGYPGKVLPVSRGEYLELDIVAFGDSSARWPFPIAIFELENSPSKDLVSYSLWKVLCVRRSLSWRIVRARISLVTRSGRFFASARRPGSSSHIVVMPKKASRWSVISVNP